MEPVARRRGRPPAHEREQRRADTLDAALAEIVDRGYEAVTVLDIARRARVSKESLYSWYGSKQGLVAAVIRRQSEQTNAAVATALGTDADPKDTLTAVAAGLLNLLLGPASIALNRAAMSSPGLAAVLLRHGRHTTGPLIESFLQRLCDRGHLRITDPADAFRLFFGLVVQDSQIRALLGEPPLSAADRSARASAAVDRFLALTAAS